MTHDRTLPEAVAGLGGRRWPCTEGGRSGEEDMERHSSNRGRLAEQAWNENFIKIVV